jgi:hypothetical protein
MSMKRSLDGGIAGEGTEGGGRAGEGIAHGGIAFEGAEGGGRAGVGIAHRRIASKEIAREGITGGE